MEKGRWYTSARAACAVLFAVVVCWGGLETFLVVDRWIRFVPMAFAVVQVAGAVFLYRWSQKKEASFPWEAFLVLSFALLSLQILAGALPQAGAYGFRAFGLGPEWMFAIFLAATAGYASIQFLTFSGTGRWLKISLAALLIYGLTALFLGASQAGGIKDLFGVDPVFGLLPLWAQGSTVLIFAALPLLLACLVYVTYSKRSGLSNIARTLIPPLAAVIVGLGAFPFYGSGAHLLSDAKTDRTGSTPGQSPENLALDGPVVREMTDLLRFDVAALRQLNSPLPVLAREFGGDAEALMRWIRENIRPAPYAGVLKGPYGTLIDGAGSSVDRALLAAELLSRSGMEVELARSRLTDEGKAMLIHRVESAWAVPKSNPVLELPTPTLDQAEKELEFFGITRESLTESRNKLIERSKQAGRRIQASIDAQVSALSKKLGNEENVLPVRELMAGVKYYWWLRVKADGAWRELHTDQPLDRSMAFDGPAEFFKVDGLPEEIYHQVEISVVASSVGSQATTPILEQRFQVARVAGAAIDLAFLPDEATAQSMTRLIDESSRSGRDPDDLIRQSEELFLENSWWTPVLKVNGQTFAESSVSRNGSVRHVFAGATPGSGTSKTLGGATDLFDSLGTPGEEPGEEPDGNSSNQLRSVEIVVKLKGPQVDTEYRRAVFAQHSQQTDLVASGDSGAFLKQYSIFVQSFVTTETVAAQKHAENLLTGLAIVEQLRTRAGQAPPAELIRDIGDLPNNPMEAILFSLARFQLNQSASKLLLVRPNLFATVSVPKVDSAPSRLVFDIMENEIAVLGAGSDAGYIALRQGVIDSWLESEILEARVGDRGGSADSVASRFGSDVSANLEGRWRPRLDSIALQQECGISDHITPATLVIAREAASPHEQCFVWTINRETGRTLAVGPGGLGVGDVEYISSLLNVWGYLLTARDCIAAAASGNSCDIISCATGFLWIGMGEALGRIGRMAAPFPTHADPYYAYPEIVIFIDIPVGVASIFDGCLVTALCSDTDNLGACVNPFNADSVEFRNF